MAEDEKSLEAAVEDAEDAVSQDELEQAWAEIEGESDDSSSSGQEDGPGPRPGGHRQGPEDELEGEPIGGLPDEAYLDTLGEGIAWGWEELWTAVARSQGVDGPPPDVLRADEFGDRTARLLDVVMQRWAPELLSRYGPEAMLAGAVIMSSVRVGRWIRQEKLQEVRERTGEGTTTSEESSPEPDQEEGAEPEEAAAADGSPGDVRDLVAEEVGTPAGEGPELPAEGSLSG